MAQVRLRPLPMDFPEITERATEFIVIIALMGAFGITVQPEYHEHIIAAVLALIGIINVWRKESKIPKAEVVE